MIVGVPKEIKQDEYRVGIVPVGVEVLTGAGHTVLVQAGGGSGISNREYRKAGARIIREAREIYRRADMIMKVKGPLPAEWKLLREDQIVLTCFHFGAAEDNPAIRAGINLAHGKVTNNAVAETHHLKLHDIF